MFLILFVLQATSDRVGLGITTVLTLSTISLDSRTDLPKVRYATALDWFLLMSFFYCIATLLEFAGVHYFTKVIKTQSHCIILVCNLRLLRTAQRKLW